MRIACGAALLLLWGVALSAQAQEPAVSLAPDQFYRAQVVRIVHEERQDTLNIAGAPVFTQQLVVTMLEGPKKNDEVRLEYSGLKEEHRLAAKDTVIVIAPGNARDPNTLYIIDRYRLRPLYGIAGLFVALTILFARWRGLMSLLGLGISVAVLTLYIVPQILAGKSPLFVILSGALVIATVAIYVAHGFNKRTSVALAGTLITVCIALFLAMAFVAAAQLLGLGSEEAFYLQTAPVQNINLQGLLLGGIVIGALGVLDDITTAQAAAVQEISRANPLLTRRELLTRGLSVGREHITSLVNTLVLAYAGASFPALLLFTVYERPWWVVANTETIAEEIVRTLVGSIALMCAVPITTALAAYFLPVPRSAPPGEAREHSGHTH